MNGLAHDNDAFREITSLLNNYKSDPDKWKYIALVQFDERSKILMLNPTRHDEQNRV